MQKKERLSILLPIKCLTLATFAPKLD